MMKNLIWYLKYLNIHLHYMKIPIEDCLGNYIQYIIWFLPRVDNLRNGSFFLPPCNDQIIAFIMMIHVFDEMIRWLRSSIQQSK